MRTRIAEICFRVLFISVSPPYVIKVHLWPLSSRMRMALQPDCFLDHASAMVVFSSTVIGRLMKCSGFGPGLRRAAHQDAYVPALGHQCPHDLRSASFGNARDGTLLPPIAPHRRRHGRKRAFWFVRIAWQHVHV